MLSCVDFQTGLYNNTLIHLPRHKAGIFPPRGIQRLYKAPYVKFHEYPSSGSRVVACGQTDGQTDMTKLIITSLNFAKAPKNGDTSAYVFNYAFE
jgi:hypothetical protein